VNTRLKKTIAVSFVAAAMFAVGSFSIGYHLPRLMREGVKTTGIVSGTQRDQRRTWLFYHFQAGARQFAGSTTTRFVKKTRGDSIAVTYLPQDPSISVGGDAQAVYRNWLRWVILLPIVTAAVPTSGGGCNIRLKGNNSG